MRYLAEIQKQSTIAQLLTSRSRVFLEDQGIAENLKQNDTDSIQSFVYSDWDANVAAWILEQKSGNTVYQELEEQLAIPLEFEDWNILNQKQMDGTEESRYSSHDMYLSTRDMAKIGQLMLQNGMWKGKKANYRVWKVG